MRPLGEIRLEDDLILTGEILRFYWKATPTVAVFIPLLPYFGPDIEEFEGIMAMKVSISRATGGSPIATYERTATRKASESLYQRKAGHAGTELAEALRDVSKQIQDAIAADARAGRFKK
jgi:hypothetical protein